ncbi:uncharacterized protein [Rutidosis leptorrhynchoides]|uniref:uncharacterized protein n=1 Tax=Rutidosis leptorrhynchoides TaxID=125765 RepID=UPI003A99C837
MVKKVKHEQASSAFLEAECAAIVRKNGLSPKLGDPGPFVVPCRIDGSEISKCLTDLGASDLKPTMMGVRLTDHSVSRLVGIIENLVIKVGVLDFPADFVVVDMITDKVVPIVLGRPFIATAGALTDWKNGKLVLRDREDYKSIPRILRGRAGPRVGPQRSSFMEERERKYEEEEGKSKGSKERSFN